MLKINRSIKFNIGTILFFLGFVLILLDYKIGVTMFAYRIPISLRSILLWSGRMLLILKVVTSNSKYKLNEFITMVSIFILFTICWLSSGYATIFDIALLMIAAKNINFDKIVKVYLIESIACLCIVLLAVRLGIIENFVTYRQGSVIQRNSYGYLHATEFATTLVWIAISYIYIFRKNYTIWHSIVCMVCAYITYFYADARISTVMLVLLCIFELTVTFRKRLYGNKFFNYMIVYLAKYGMMICTAISFIATICYNPLDSKMNILNNFFTGRLELQHIGFLKYGFRFFGQKVDMVGMSLNYVNSIFKNYFYIDCAYIQMGMRYGLVFLLMMIIVFYLATKRAIKTRDYMFLFIMILIAFNGLIEQHIFFIAYNPFMFKIFSS